MKHLTDKEKADRYDALQTAFKYTKERYADRRSEAQKPIPGIIGIYNKGLADAYTYMIEDIERWCDCYEVKEGE